MSQSISLHELHFRAGDSDGLTPSSLRQKTETNETKALVVRNSFGEFWRSLESFPEDGAFRLPRSFAMPEEIQNHEKLAR